MRELLLGKRVGKVSWVEGIHNLWPLYTEGAFLLVLFTEKQTTSEEEVWDLLDSCYFKIGILSKKSTSGKKSFLASIRYPERGQAEETKSVASS